MTSWLLSIEDTPTGITLALCLAMASALALAVFGALQNGQHDPWLTRASIGRGIFVLSVPVALFAVPWPRGFEWVVILGALGIHFAYKPTMALACERAACTVVYPVVRGTGPLAIPAFAALFLSEHYRPLQ